MQLRSADLTPVSYPAQLSTTTPSCTWNIVRQRGRFGFMIPDSELVTTQLALPLEREEKVGPHFVSC